MNSQLYSPNSQPLPDRVAAMQGHLSEYRLNEVEEELIG